MASQTGKNFIIGYHVESAYNTAPGAGASRQLRFNASAGLATQRALIETAEVRSDGLSAMPRLGSAMAPGDFSVDAVVGAFDDIFEAVMRSTWVAAVVITADNTAAHVSFAVTDASTIVFIGTTTLLTAGLRVGDVFRFAGMSAAANNAINLRVKAIDATGLIVTVHGAPLTIQAADNACTLTIEKKLKNGASPVKRTFYVDQYNADVDISEVFGGVRFIELKLSGNADGMVNLGIKLLGGARGAVLATAASPYYTAPTQSAGTALTFVDATLSFNGADIITATAFELTYTIAAKTQAVIGAVDSPDVFDNDAKLSGSLSFIRQDLAINSLFLAETEVPLHILLVANMAEPKDNFSVFVPRVKLTNPTAPLGADGALIVTVPFVTGVKDVASGFDATLLTICSSAP